MHHRAIGFSLLLLFASAASGGASLAQGLSSPLVERTMFREGEVSRSTRAFGDWVLLCDEILRMRQRFCSLRTMVQDEHQATIVLDVSTGDDARPAALLRLPTNLAVSDGINFGPSRSRKLPIAVCGASECQSVWSLTKADIAALDSGRSIEGSYRSAGISDLPVLSVRLHALPTVRFHLSGRGFHDAVEASLR